jgi:hypothetical protein
MNRTKPIVALVYGLLIALVFLAPVLAAQDVRADKVLIGNAPKSLTSLLEGTS